MNNLSKFIFFIVLVFSFVIAILNYNTFKFQTPIFIESNDKSRRNLSLDYFDVKKFLLPKTSLTTIPIKALFGSLMMDKGHDKEAFVFLKESLNENPFIGYTENQLAKYYLKIGKLDSAYYYSSISIQKMPISIHYETFISIATKRGDIKRLDSIFNISKSNNKAGKQLYDFFLSNKFNINSINETFKAESKFAYNKYGGLKFKYFYHTSLIGMDNIGLARASFDKGTEYFMQNNFKEAIVFYLKAVELNPYEYPYLESLAGTYVANEDFNQAKIHLKDLMNRFKTTDGKSEYLLGMAYKGLLKKDSSCYFFELSKLKNYNLAKFRLKENCN